MSKGVAALPPDVRERIAARSDRLAKVWSILSYLGFAVLFVGIAKFFNIIKGGPKIPWGLYCIAIGICIICLERVLRSWDRYLLFSREARGTGVPGNALIATLIITVVEATLASVIGYNIFTRAAVTGGKVAQEPAAQQATEGEGEGKDNVTIYVPESEALKILEKDKDYLDLFVRWGDVKTQVLGNDTVYLRKDLDDLRQSGLPTKDEMVKELKERGEAPPGVKPKSRPPSKKDKRGRRPPADGTDALEE
jgi:hypothetical protein